LLHRIHLLIRTHTIFSFVTGLWNGVKTIDPHASCIYYSFNGSIHSIQKTVCRREAGSGLVHRKFSLGASFPWYMGGFAPSFVRSSSPVRMSKFMFYTGSIIFIILPTH
jgi:hypothetical protein